MTKTKPAANKSQLIRDIFTKNPTTSASDVIKTLGEKGIEVNKGLVYFVKGKMGVKSPAKAVKTETTNAPSDQPEANRSQIIREFLEQNPKMPVPQVVSALEEKGTKVSRSHVYLVKGRMQAEKQKSTSSNEKPEIPKSQIVRDFIMANPHQSVSEVVDALADKGVWVSKNLVHTVRARIKPKKEQETKAERTNEAMTEVGNGNVLTTIKRIKNMATEMGGIQNLKALVEALAE